MPLLKKITSRGDYKMIGVTMRSKFHSYLSLYCLAKGISKASLLKDLIGDWIDEQKAKYSDKVLLDEIKERVNEQWTAYIEDKPHSNMERYREEIENELLSKGIPQNYIDIITKDLK